MRGSFRLGLGTFSYTVQASGVTTKLPNLRLAVALAQDMV